MIVPKKLLEHILSSYIKTVHTENFHGWSVSLLVFDKRQPKNIQNNQRLLIYPLIPPLFDLLLSQLSSLDKDEITAPVKNVLTLCRQVWSEGWEDMPVLCQHTEESLHNETRSEIRHFIACSKSIIISSRTAESA